MKPKGGSLFCSLCGCAYALWARKEGSVCGDQSGGINDKFPCDGVLERGEYTDEIKNRQRASMYLPPLEQP